MSECLESRIEKLEKGNPAAGDIKFILVRYDGDPEPTPEEMERLKEEAITKNPNQEIVIVTAVPRPS